MPKIKSTPTLKKQSEISKKHKSLTVVQKKEVCLKKAASFFLKNKDLTNEYEVSEGMISDTLKVKDHLLAMYLNSYQARLRCEKKTPFPNIEEALTIGIENALQVDLIIIDNILSTKALNFAYLLEENNFKGSNDWVDNFKKGYNLKQYNIHDKAASALLEDLDTMGKNLYQKLRNYNSEDIFNCDKMGLF